MPILCLLSLLCTDTVGMVAFKASHTVCWPLQRDAAMVRLLLEAGAELQQPLLLDIVRPRAGVFASKVGLSMHTRLMQTPVSRMLAWDKHVLLKHALTASVSNSPFEPGAQAGTYSPDFYRYCPPAFKAAVVELLRITRKHGYSVRNGKLVWPFWHDTLNRVLLPLLGQDMSAWL